MEPVLSGVEEWYGKDMVGKKVKIDPQRADGE